VSHVGWSDSIKTASARTFGCADASTWSERHEQLGRHTDCGEGSCTSGCCCDHRCRKLSRTTRWRNCYSNRSMCACGCSSSERAVRKSRFGSRLRRHVHCSVSRRSIAAPPRVPRRGSHARRTRSPPQRTSMAASLGSVIAWPPSSAVGCRVRSSRIGGPPGVPSWNERALQTYADARKFLIETVFAASGANGSCPR
jgi:hypothetical protein